MKHRQSCPSWNPLWWAKLTGTLREPRATRLCYRPKCTPRPHLTIDGLRYLLRSQCDWTRRILWVPSYLDDNNFAVPSQSLHKTRSHRTSHLRIHTQLSISVRTWSLGGIELPIVYIWPFWAIIAEWSLPHAISTSTTLNEQIFGCV
jgi:hypothetical protein